jgi:hypothetical protein
MCLRQLAVVVLSRTWCWAAALSLILCLGLSSGVAAETSQGRASSQSSFDSGSSDHPERTPQASAEPWPGDGPETANTLVTPTWGLGFYLGTGVLTLGKSARAQVSGFHTSTPFGVGFLFTLLRYVFIDLGVGWMSVADTVHFVETTCPIDGHGGCATTVSGTEAVQAWASVGPQYRLVRPIGGSALAITGQLGLGYSYLGVSRKAGAAGQHCYNCQMDELLTGAGSAVVSAIDLAYMIGSEKAAATFGVRIAYDQFLTGPLQNSLWVSGMLEFVL